MHTGDNIIKSIAIFATATILFNAIAPTLAQAAKHLQGAEVNATALVRDAYIAVTYYDGNNRERTARAGLTQLARHRSPFAAASRARRPLPTPKSYPWSWAKMRSCP